MIIRIRGGRAGIMKYLKTGRMRNRTESREELDERVILHGDMDFTERIIERMKKRGEKYLHITLSFKEPHLSAATLRGIVSEFEKFTFAAYAKDEYTFYAEAHLPKKKSLIDQRTQEILPRFPHIHIVIPEYNLLSQRGLNPFGKVSQNTRYTDAFQEYINEKYQLESPKTNRRTDLSSRHRIISRQKGDDFQGSTVNIKKALKRKIESGEISGYDSLIQYLSGFGEVKKRNQGTPIEYLNFRPENAAKGINLKEFPFTMQYFAEIMSGKHDGDYLVREKIQREADLEKWYSRRALEIKFLNSGNRKVWKHYRALDSNSKNKYLAELKEKFNKKYQRPNSFPSEQRELPIMGLDNQSVPSYHNSEVLLTNSILGQACSDLHKTMEKADPLEEIIVDSISPQDLLLRLKDSHGVIPSEYQSMVDGDSILVGGFRLSPYWFFTETYAFFCR
jgi:hypothetical protein